VLHQRGTGEPVIRAHGVVADLADADSEHLVAALVTAGVPVRQFVLEQPDLEDVFVELTGEGYDVDQ
jgi:ABC-2 type transport system ATP-binding protein